MDWDVMDFAIFGAMIGGVGLVYALLRHKASNARYRIALGIALAAAFFLTWVNGAVGIIGNEGDEANLMYFGVLVFAALAAIVARFRPNGMALALLATAIAQAGVTAYALLNKLGSTAPIWPKDVLILNGFFVTLWLLSAWLFRSAARKQSGYRDVRFQ